MPSPPLVPRALTPVEAPRQFDRPQFGVGLEQADHLVRASQARGAFAVDGTGLTVAVIDSGLRATHVDFAGRVAAQHNFTSDNGGDPQDAADGHGHGTNVTGILAARGIHTGIAPGARIVPLKVLTKSGAGNLKDVAQALDWVIEHRAEHRLSAVSLSVGDGGNYTSDSSFAEEDDIRARLRTLRQAGVVVGVAAGNDYFTHDSRQGMGYPAIFRESVSVGAVYDDFEGGFEYGNGAVTFSAAPDRITPFSQRLHESVDPHCRTDIFAPGAPVTSTGINNDEAESVQRGTSQATPVVVGVALLMQELHLRLTERLPEVDDLVAWMRRSGAPILDGDDEDDNVSHTNETFVRVDAYRALDTVRRHLQKELLLTGRPLR